MAQAWMPGVERIDAAAAPTPPGFGAPRAVWTVTGTDPGSRSAAEEARRLACTGQAVHLVWNPRTGEVVQSLAATRRSPIPLGSTGHGAARTDHGREGRVCLTVAVVALAEAPFTDGPMHGRAPLLAWMDSWEVARRWLGPGGDGSTRRASIREWSLGGHFGRDRVPGSSGSCPGRVDGARLLAEGAGPAHPRIPAQQPSTPT
ncbi:hypothetical protein [Nocardiopsis sp. LOL_012]|uniref:hypothetical protein n=1 Tax=Nocardiopsis sp. LOL_012 TaxID=3345409 RepID=UPI003A8496A2